MIGIRRFNEARGALALVALLLVQTPLWLNPGYFSHDELQWGARAAVAHWSELRFVSFLDWQAFQFRPLTFNLWLLISHALFDTPRLFHALFVGLGTLNALLLAGVLRRAGCRASVAFCAALVFALSPFAAWVHGWVGCLADLLWVGFGLGIVAVLQRLDARSGGYGSPSSAPTSTLQPTFPTNAGLAGAGKPASGLRWNNGERTRIPGKHLWLAAITAALATALALLAKEAALSIPALLGLGAVLLRLRRTWLAATLASGIVAIVYLALRMDTLTSPDETSSYTLHVAALPLRWLEYTLFPWKLDMQEIHVMGLLGTSEWLKLAVAPLALALCLWRASPRLWLAWLAGSVLALGPVLALPFSANQYGYGFAALCCGVAALAWSRLRRAGRITLALLATIVVAHGFQIQKRMLEVGRLQAVFSPSLAEQAQAQPQGAIALWPERWSQHYIYARLSHDVPTWRGVPLGARVGMADNAGQATHLIAADGQVRPRGTSP